MHTDETIEDDATWTGQMNQDMVFPKLSSQRQLINDATFLLVNVWD